MKEVLLLLFGYLCGSILFSEYLPKFLCGVDITQASEDHNPGTANAMKYAGVPVGLLCLLCDLGKGFFPVRMALGLTDMESYWFAFLMAAPAAGHAFSLFKRGHGGKAIAVSFGTMLGLWPMKELLAALIVLYLFFSLVLVIRPNERRTVVTFFLFAAAAAVFGLTGRIPTPVGLGAFFIAAIVIHKNNLEKKPEGVCEEVLEHPETVPSKRKSI